MKVKYAAIVVLALLLGLGAGYLFRHAPWSEPGKASVSEGNFEHLYAASRSPVILYSLSTCPFCKETRDLLNSEGISFVEKSLDESPQAKAEAEELGVKVVPVLLVGKYRIDGYDRVKILDAMGRAKSVSRR